MHNLNLYKYYDKSLAEVNKEYLYALKNKPVRAAKKTNKRKYALIGALLIGVSAVVINYTGVFDDKPVDVVDTPPAPDLRTEEEKQGYVQIQIFEFADTPVETLQEEPIDDNETAVAENSSEEHKIEYKDTTKKEETKETKKLQENKKAEEIKTAKQDKKPVLNTSSKNTGKKAPVIMKKYSILFENIDEKQYNRIVKLKEKYNTDLKIVDAYSNTYSVWKVYEKSPDGDLIEGGERVHHMEDFLTKEDALKFASKRNLHAVIKQVGVTEKTYNIELCCADLEKSKTIAKESKILDRIIKIIRVE